MPAVDVAVDASAASAGSVSLFSTATTYDAVLGTLLAGNGNLEQDLETLQAWKEAFERSGRKMLKFHVFANSVLTQRFEAARARLEELGRPSEELQLFHGTAEANFESILRDGLHVGGTRGIDIGIGCASGVGIYLVDYAAGAMGYTKGANKVFGCRVLPGKVTGDVEKVRKIPNVDLGVGAERFDSYCGPYEKGKLYVVRSPDLVLPCYMIEFEAQEPLSKQPRHGAPQALYPMVPPNGGPQRKAPRATARVSKTKTKAMAAGRSSRTVSSEGKYGPKPAASQPTPDVAKPAKRIRKQFSSQDEGQEAGKSAQEGMITRRRAAALRELQVHQ